MPFLNPSIACTAMQHAHALGENVFELQWHRSYIPRH